MTDQTPALADVRRDVLTLLRSVDPAELGPAIVRLERWAEGEAPAVPLKQE